MNIENVRDLAEAGEFETLYKMWQDLCEYDDQRSAKKMDKRTAGHLRLLEWGVARGVDRARDMGRVAKHGSNGGNSIGNFGIPLRWMQDIRRQVPGHISFDRMVLAIDEASIEGHPSRRAIGRALHGTEVEYDRPEVLRGTLRHRPDRIIQSTVETLRGLCDGIDMLTAADFDSLDSTEIAGWTAEIYECRRIIGKLHKELNARV